MEQLDQVWYFTIVVEHGRQKHKKKLNGGLGVQQNGFKTGMGLVPVVSNGSDAHVGQNSHL